MMTSAGIALERGLNFQVGCQNRLRVNSNADKALTLLNVWGAECVITKR